MGIGIFARDPVLPPRLRPGVLGRTAGTFRYYRGHDGLDSGVHGVVGDQFPEDTKAHRPPGLGAIDRTWRGSGVDEPVVEPRRGASRPGGGSRVNISGV